MSNDTSLDTRVGHRLHHIRNAVMGLIRISDFCRDVHDFKAADATLQQGVNALYEHLTTLQESQAEVVATGLELRNKEKQENGTGRECSSCGSSECRHGLCSECNTFHTDCEGCEPSHQEN